MSKRHLIIGGFLLLLGLGVALFFLKHKSSALDAAPRAPVSLPSMTFKGIDGREVNLSDFRGKPLVINVWASWCSFCKDELLGFVSLQREFSTGNKDAVFLAINRSESPEQVQKVMQELTIGTSSIMLLDSDDTLYQTLGGFAMPETLFVDKDGVIQERQRGPSTMEELRRRIQDLIQH